ncbi:MAG: glycosyltransferase [Gammaproteobacteria bacterium]|nr:MAG: glycosyltransferase [Gammaproteobacteria bacterium]
MKYSLVIPVYKNEESIPELLDVVSCMNQELGGELEVVMVIDGSPDRCYTILQESLPKQSFASQLILHSRNYGSFAAIRTGLQAAKGSFFAVMAADLQEPPELAVEFFHSLESDEADILVGTRESREDPLGSRIASGVFWSLYRRFVIPEMPAGGVDMFGCNAHFRDELLRLEEAHSSLIGLLFWLGFRRKTVGYHRRVRKHGVSAWTLRKKITYLMDSIFSFSDLPVRLLISLGMLGLGFAVIFGVIVAALRITGVMEVTGYAATVITILFFGGLNAFGLGIIGAYVWRAYGNTQGRPLAVVMRASCFEGSRPAGDGV